MRVIVIGAGIVGVTTAWYLTRDGHDVTLVDRLPGPGLETSFANAGGICPGFAGPWAAPGMPLKALKWLFRETAPLKIRFRPDPQQWIWLARFLRNCTPDRFQRNKVRMQRVAHYSLACLRALRAETGITYDHASRGVLQLFASEPEMEGGARAARILAELGVVHRLVDRQEVVAIEPALGGSGAPIVGGLHLPGDETGDCHMFCRQLTQMLRTSGCRLMFEVDVLRLHRSGDRITGVATSAGELVGDAYVVTTGPFAPDLLRPLGIRVPIYPVKGYSMTCEIASEPAAPLSSVMDEHSKIMITRLGHRIRAAGAAELAGFDRRVQRSATRAMRERVAQLFPGAADYPKAEYWCGFRPMTPDGPARIGPARCRNLFLNVGHGSNGWTQACGSARIVSDMVAGRSPEIDP